MIESTLCPNPQKIIYTEDFFAVPKNIKLDVLCSEADGRVKLIIERFVEDLKTICGISIGDDNSYCLELSLQKATGQSEGYTLTLDSEHCAIVADDEAGLQHGCQSLLQIFSLNYGNAHPCEIHDYPHYKTRSVMLDLGRAVFSSAYIKRIIRIMARLKLNSLHLHLFDNELSGLRFETLPIGHENPFAITIAELGEIIRYARSYGISVVPEIESWGHVNSIVYHYPELCGTYGRYGASFTIGTRSFELLEKIYDEIMPVLEDKSQFHLGLDEADWSLDPTETHDQKDFDSPEKMVKYLYDILMKVAKRHGKDITMRVWADHNGRPIPKAIEDKIIIEPWNYWEASAEKVENDLKKYGSHGQMRLMMGGGMAADMQVNGEYLATGMWCKKAKQLNNVEGINITIWGTNDLSACLIGVYVGANYAWTPDSPGEIAKTFPHDTHRGTFLQFMSNWQGYFKDADPDAIMRDRGPVVCHGFYKYGDKHNQPVCPSAESYRKGNIERGTFNPINQLNDELKILFGLKQ